MLVGGTKMKRQALKFSNEMKIQDLQLKFTDGWFRHFKGRHAPGYIINRPTLKQSLQTFMQLFYQSLQIFCCTLMQSKFNLNTSI